MRRVVSIARIHFEVCLCIAEKMTCMKSINQYEKDVQRLDVNPSQALQILD